MIRFILDNAADKAILDSTPDENLSYPMDNLKKISRLRSMRSVDTNTFLIEGTLPSGDSTSVSGIVLAKHNLSTSIIYTINLYEDYNLTGTLHSYGPYTVSEIEAATDLFQWGEFNWGTISWGADNKDYDNRDFYDLVWWAPNKTPIENIKSFSIELDVASEGTDPIFCNDYSIYCNDSSYYCNQLYKNPGAGGHPGIDYFEIGRLYIGEYIEPTYNISPNHNISWKENTMQYRPTSGTLRSDYTTSNRSFEFSLKTIPNTDREDLHKQLVAKGMHEDFYVSIFPEGNYINKEIDYSGLVKFTKVPQYTEFISDYYISNFVMEET